MEDKFLRKVLSELFSTFPRWEKQFFFLKLGEKNFEIETINQEIRNTLTSNFDVFNDLVGMKEMQEISENEYKEDLLDLLSKQSNLLKEYIQYLKEKKDGTSLQELVKKISDMISKQGEVGRVFKFLNELKMSEKIKKQLSENASNFADLFLSDDFDKALEILSSKNARLYSLWKRMSNDQKQKVVKEGKEILEKLLTENSGTIGEDFQNILNKRIPSKGWKGFFKSFFYEGLWKPFADAFSSRSYASKGDMIRIKNSSNCFYGRMGEVININGKVAKVWLDNDETIVPFEDVELIEENDDI